MIGINTAIARVASDGLTITSISFSLKSTVATKWLGEQGVMGQQAKNLRDSLPSEKASARPAQATAASQPTSPPRSISPSEPLTSPSVPPRPHVEPAPRPYNLDQVISERRHAESELEDMMKDMRH
jgi:serine protease Do